MTEFRSLIFTSSDDEETSDEATPDELYIDYDIPPLERFNRFHKGTLVMHRIFALRDLRDHLEEVGYGSLVNKALGTLIEVTEDQDPSVKTVCLEILPTIAQFIIEKGKDGHAKVIEKVVPICVKLLCDKNVQTQMAAHESFISICSKLTKQELESSILSVISNLIEDKFEEDNRVEGLALLKDVSILLGPETSFTITLPKISLSVVDPSFRVRKANVDIIAELSKQFTIEQSRLHLLPKFLVLCDDKIWGVRKACAVSLKTMMNNMTAEERAGPLAEAAKKLSTDTSRWVKSAFNESLGEIIASYAKDAEVPEFLLNCFLSLINGDQDGVFACAYNLPAVVYTLKRENWPKVKDTYVKLSNEVQWNIRRTLAHSTHEIAKVIGPQQASEDLVPCFDLFLRDLEEVKLGSITNYASFVENLTPELQLIYLVKLTSLYEESSTKFKEIIAKQIIPMSNLYNTSCIYEHLVPLCLKLCGDLVYKVRESATPAICHVLNKFTDPEDKNMRDSLINEIKSFATHRSFMLRQQYARICESMVVVIPDNWFEEEFLSLLVSLSRDRVPNVRYCVARAIAQIVSQDSFKNRHVILETVEKLEKDTDPNVREILTKRK